jgi:hypothetical protein
LKRQENGGFKFWNMMARLWVQEIGYAARIFQLMQATMQGFSNLDKKANKKFCCPIAFTVSNWAMLLAREVGLLLGDGRSDSDVRQIGLENLITCVA